MIVVNDVAYFNTEEVSKILGLSKRSIMRLVKSKNIDCYKPSPRKTLFTSDMIERYIQK
jgi:excisionase family DNA binding protein